MSGESSLSGWEGMLPKYVLYFMYTHYEGIQINEYKFINSSNTDTYDTRTSHRQQTAEVN